MESTRKHTNTKRHFRLLTTVLLSIANSLIFALETNEYIFSQPNDIFAQEQSSVSVTILGFKPSQITYSVPQLPKTIKLIKSTKTASTVTNDNKTIQSTIISFTLLFENEGVYSIEPLEITIDSQETIKIPFQEFVVYPNLNNIEPELYFEPISDLYSLQPTEYLLSARYIKDVLDYKVGISESALIEEKKRLYNHNSKKEFSTQLIPIASYNCIPFASGTIVIENISATVLDYNDVVQTITLDNANFLVLESTSLSEKTFGKEQFFDTNENNITTTQTIDKNVEKAQLVFNKQVKELQTIKPIIIVCIISSVLLIIIAIVFFILKRIKRLPVATPTTIAIIGFCLLLTTVYFSIKFNENHGITYTTNLYAIPEWEGQILNTVESGSKVAIVKDIGDWLLIEKEDKSTGWILKKDCLIIEN